MDNSDLINRLSEAASYNVIAASGYTVDVNGHTKAINGNDRGKYASMANLILNDVILKLENEIVATEIGCAGSAEAAQVG